MDKLNKEELQKLQRSSKYNEEPIYYCKKCLMPNIKTIPNMNDLDYCDSCGATDIGKCSIEEWEEMYIKKFGHRYLDEY